MQGEKHLQLEWAQPRTVASLFSCSVYIGNIRTVSPLLWTALEFIEAFLVLMFSSAAESGV